MLIVNKMPFAFVCNQAYSVHYKGSNKMPFNWSHVGGDMNGLWLVAMGYAAYGILKQALSRYTIEGITQRKIKHGLVHAYIYYRFI